MPVVAQRSLVARAGAAQSTGCVVTIWSYTADAGTITCNGITQNILAGDWAQVGTDNVANFPQACFRAEKTVALPVAFGDYPYTIAQGANTFIGYCTSKPGAADDYAAFLLNCDYQAYPSAGFYPRIRWYKENGPLRVAGLFEIGDLSGYVDTWIVDDRGAGGTGLNRSSNNGNTTDSPYFTKKVFDYALAYMSALGMLGSSANEWGRDEDRVWVEGHCNIIPQFDDHNFQQNQRGTGGAYASGKTAYDAFYGALQPTENSIRVDDVTANHWGYSLGCVKFVCPDGITGAGLAGTQRFSTGQKKDLLNALGTDEPFKLMLGDFGIRYLDAANVSQTSGAQEALHYDYPADYQQIFTFDTASSAAAGLPASIMANPKTNGIGGVFVLTNHDFHQQISQWNNAPAYAGNLEERFHMLTHGSNNRMGSPSMGETLYNNIVAGISSGNYYTYNNITVHWAARTAENDSLRPRGLRVEVYGSRTPRELRIIQLDGEGNEVKTHRWLERSGNMSIPDDWQMPSVLMGTNL